MFGYTWYFSLIITLLLSNDIISTSFSPDTSDFDAYGLKIAVNDVLFVEAKNDGETFLLQYAPYNYTFDSLQCSFDYDDPSHYIYSVGVGIKQNSTLNPFFYYTGEVASQSFTSTDRSGRNGTFIGVWINLDPQNIQDYSTMRRPLPCNYFRAEQIQYVSSYGHQEYFVMIVEPYGKYAIGLATDFAFIYQPYPTNTMTTESSSVVWPNNSTFNPCAADASDTFTIVAGFLAGSAQSRIRATPTVYLIWNTNLTVLSTWSYTATNNSWQSRLTYSGIDTWNNKYTMSVKINSKDPTRVLIGMPFLNTIFLFLVTNNGQNLTLISSIDNGQSVGYGKSVTWLTESQAAVLVSTYSLDYSTWYSSKVYLYTSLNDTYLPSSPSAIIPNSQQPLPSTINSVLIQIISTPSVLAILDTDGGVLLILSELAGYYPSTDTTNSPIAASMPVVSYSTTCIAGTYKTDAGIYPCNLCPIGTRNSGQQISLSCLNCSSSDNFCPLGAVYEINSSYLTSVSQAYAYPQTPETNVFEDILLYNMFSLDTSTHCLIVSPLFWTIILLILFILLLAGMASMNWCVKPPKRDQWRARIKTIFRRTDLVGEGELWLGGLASIAVLLMSAFAYAFAISYLNQYPSESVGPSTFACDTTLRNAKFQSTLQPLAVPASDSEQPMFDLLNQQNFTLQIDFLNTVTLCMKVSIVEVSTSSTTTALNFLSCTDQYGILSMKVVLPEHDIKIVVTINDIQLIGGIRVGLTGPGQQNDSYTLKELDFLQTFYSQTARTLAQTVTIDLELTKVINETESLSGSDSIYGGLWYPIFTYSQNEMFITDDNYRLSANLTSTTLTIAMSETSYYIKNVQAPIAKKPEVLFRTLLFVFLCLEICAMVFLIFKLLIIPLYLQIYTCITHQTVNTVEPIHHIKVGHH